MGSRRSWPDAGLRIAIALAAGFVLCGAAPHGGQGGPGPGRSAAAL
jgi:hypothetical protein